MIVNMPVNGTGGANNNNNNTDTSAASSNNNNNNTLLSEQNQSQCDYNYLKRKYESEQQLHDNYAAANPWKKRHLEPHSDNTDNSYGQLLDYEAANTQQQQTLEVPHDAMSFQLQLDANAGSVTSVNSSMCSTTAASNTAAFINDLFAYDASLLVPVATACSPSSLPSFSAAAAAANAVSSFETDANWQATDLLELDHRYNSGLQAELGQLQATLPSMQLPAPQNEANSFLVPQKQPAHRQLLSNGLAVATKLRPLATNSEAEPDFEDKNLSWLLNFKFDEFPHLSPDVGNARLAQPQQQQQQHNSSLSDATTHNSAGGANTSPAAYKSNSASPASTSNHSHNSNQSALLSEQRARSPKGCAGATSQQNNNATNATTTTTTGTTSTKTGRKFEELVMEVTSEMDANDMIVAEHVVVEDTTSKAPKKPPFTYTELIEYALEDKGELTVSGIYQWISDRFPYYKSNDDRWKNSVRHNLSINPHFRKGAKAPQGAGHLWAISSGDSAENVLAWEHKKQRLDLFFKMESINRERIQQHQQQMQQLQQQQQQCSSPQHTCHQQQQQQQMHATPTTTTTTTQQRNDHCLYDEAAVAAAAITQEMLQHPADGNGCHNQPHGEEARNCSTRAAHHTHSQAQSHAQPQTHPHPNSHHQQRLLPFNDLLSDEELRKTAGQILNGIHREVEVQSVNSIISTYHDVLLDNEDYLNPIHKDVVVTESGLRQHHIGNGSNSGSAAGSNSLGTGLTTHSQYYITEIDPMELGIQMSHQVEPSEEEVLFSDEFNLNYFGYNPGSDIVA